MNILLTSMSRYGTLAAMETHDEGRSVRDVFLRTIAVLGLIAILLLGAWGIIQLAVALPSIFTNLGGNIGSLFSFVNKESVSVTLPKQVTSGTPLDIAWTHKNKDGEYSYTISYGCSAGLSLKAPLPNGSTQAIACNTPFNFTNASAKLSVTPTITGNSNVALSVTITATKLSTGTVSVQGSATTSVVPKAATPSQPTVTTATPTSSKGPTSSTYYPAKAVTTLYGYGDLAVRINSVVPNGSLSSVQFTIENVGSNVVSSGWMFSAQLPIQGGYTYQSQPQQTLKPGDKIVYTLSFSRDYGYQGYQNYGYGYNYPYYGSHDPVDGYTGWNYYGNGGYYCNGYNCSYPQNYSNYGYSGSVTVTADPYAQIYELNRANNTASAPSY